MGRLTVLQRELRETDLPAEVREVMAYFEKLGVPPILYGGAPSDHALGRPYTDIDLHFAFGSRPLGIPGWGDLPLSVRKMFRVTPEHRGFLRKLRLKGKRILGLRSGYSLMPVPDAPAFLQKVNIIIAARDVVTPEEILNDCDLGFRQMAVTRGVVFTTPLFHQDAKRQIMTVWRCNDLRDLQKTLRRVEKFRAEGRYPDWEVRVSPGLLAALGIRLEEW